MTETETIVAPKESKITDQSLAKAIRNSDSEAFALLYHRYSEALTRFIYYRTYSMEITRDYLQEVFTRFWQHRDSIDTKKSLKAYLYRIANNYIIDQLRKKRSAKAYFGEMKYHTHATEQRAIEIKIAIEDAVNGLPEKLKTVFILSRYQGLKYSEIAEICSISIKTVEARMSKALQKLREKIREEQ